MSVIKSERVVFQQLVLNKLWIPDVLIDIVKDYLYYDKNYAIHKQFQKCLNMSVNTLYTESRFYLDKEGCRRMAQVAIGQIRENPLELTRRLQLQTLICVTCGNFCNQHGNMSGLCLRANENDMVMSIHGNALTCEDGDETDDEGDFW